jgi:hypothetical protein
LETRKRKSWRPEKKKVFVPEKKPEVWKGGPETKAVD